MTTTTDGAGAAGSFGHPTDSTSTDHWVASGAIASGIASLLAASCCVLPLALGLVGLGGSWLAVLGPFVAWRDPILIVVACVLALAWFGIVRRALRSDRSGTRPRALVAISFATLAFGLAAAAPLWARQATATLIDLHMNALTERAKEIQP